MVAPLVGAWIEILNAGTYYYKELTVAPLVGAWIEIIDVYAKDLISLSLLSWERGLK